MLGNSSAGMPVCPGLKGKGLVWTERAGNADLQRPVKVALPVLLKVEYKLEGIGILKKSLEK